MAFMIGNFASGIHSITRSTGWDGQPLAAAFVWRLLQPAYVSGCFAFMPTGAELWNGLRPANGRSNLAKLLVRAHFPVS